jgi:hypothetical protein
MRPIGYGFVEIRQAGVRNIRSVVSGAHIDLFALLVYLELTVFLRSAVEKGVHSDSLSQSGA